MKSRYDLFEPLFVFAIYFTFVLFWNYPLRVLWQGEQEDGNVARGILIFFYCYELLFQPRSSLSQTSQVGLYSSFFKEEKINCEQSLFCSKIRAGRAAKPRARYSSRSNIVDLDPLRMGPPVQIH